MSVSEKLPCGDGLHCERELFARKRTFYVINRTTAKSAQPTSTTFQKPLPKTTLPKTVDIGEKLRGPNLVFGTVELCQPAVIAFKKRVLVGGVKSGLDPQLRTILARRFRFCAVAARRNSSLAPFRPVSRRRLMPRCRFRWANNISTFLRLRRLTP